MDKRNYFEEYKKAILEIYKRQPDLIKINNSDRTISLETDEMSVRYIPDMEQGLNEIYMECLDEKDGEAIPFSLYYTSTSKNDVRYKDRNGYDRHLGENISLREIFGDQVFSASGSDLDISPDSVDSIDELFGKSKATGLLHVSDMVKNKFRKFIEQFPEFNLAEQEQELNEESLDDMEL